MKNKTSPRIAKLLLVVYICNEIFFYILFIWKTFDFSHVFTPFLYHIIWSLQWMPAVLTQRWLKIPKTCSFLVSCCGKVWSLYLTRRFVLCRVHAKSENFSVSFSTVNKGIFFCVQFRKDALSFACIKTSRFIAKRHAIRRLKLTVGLNVPLMFFVHTVCTLFWLTDYDFY